MEEVVVKSNKKKAECKQTIKPSISPTESSYSDLLYHSSLQKMPNKMMNEKAKSLITCVIPSYCIASTASKGGTEWWLLNPWLDQRGHNTRAGTQGPGPQSKGNPMVSAPTGRFLMGYFYVLSIVQFFE